jgi:AcrR family transcriptional regulator
MTYEYKLIGFSRMTSTKSKRPDRALQRELEPIALPEDHRVRTGAARREQTRRKLIESALKVFAEKGIDAPLIDDFIAEAGVARGTFYNHFRTTQELLDAVTSELSDEILAAIDAVVLRIPDPLERMVCGCLLYMHVAVDVPAWGVFITRTGFRGEALGKLVDVYLPRDLELARRAGKLDYPSVRAARDLVLGCVTQAIQHVVAGGATQEHPREVLALGLRGLGVPVARASELCRMALPQAAMPEGFGFAALLHSGG